MSAPSAQKITASIAVPIYPTLKSKSASLMDIVLICFLFSTCHMELIAEISIGHGIQPMSETMNGSAARRHGVGASKSGAYSRCLKRAMTTAKVVATVSAVITHFESLSRNL